MFNLIGQKNLLAILDSYTLATLPRSLMLIGEAGCGKHTFFTHLANKLKLELVDITERGSNEDLDSFLVCPIPKMYLINLSTISEKEQNKFLKFIEEPATSCFIALAANSEVGVLDTILNRCIKLHFAQYTFSELQEIANFLHPNFSELDYQICRTPGKLIDLDSSSTNKLKLFCEKIIAMKKPIQYGMLLGQYTKINCFENYDQFNFDAFLNMMTYVAASNYAKVADSHSYNILEITRLYLKKLAVAPKVNRHDFLLSFFTVLYQEVILND